MSGMADELQTLRAQLAARERELAAAQADAQELARTLAHDLRAPLRHVLAYSSLLREMLDSGEDVAPALGTLEGSAQQLGAMLDALLALNRVAQAPLQPGRTPGAVLLAEARRAAESAQAADLQGRSVHWQLPAELPELRGDPALLRQALAAVLDNALKFSRDTPQPRITVTAGPAADGALCLCVRDNGVGFDMDHAARLFQPFVRLHGAHYAGVGTGLATVRQILRRHGGTVQAEAASGQGCTIRMTLPAG